MIEEDEETSEGLRQLEKLSEEYPKCSCVASQRIQTALDLARRQDERIKSLLHENALLLELNETLKAQKSDNGNICGEPFSGIESQLDPSVLPNSLTMEEYCENETLLPYKDFSSKIELTEIKEEKVMEECQASAGSDENLVLCDVKEETNQEIIPYIANVQSKCSKVEKQEVYQVTVTDLPEEALQLIFTYFNFNDLLSIQKVCTTWDLATRHTSVWKYVPLQLYGQSTLEKLRKVSDVPYLHTVTGFFDNGDELLHILMNNVVDLRKMDCCISNEVSTGTLQNFLDKFKNLEFIRMSTDFPLELSEAISIHPNIISVCFYCEALDRYIPDICRIVSRKFFALKICFEGDICFDSTEHMENALINQLTDLNSNFSSDVSLADFELTFKNGKLESLYIGIWENYVKSLNLSGMKELKLLSLYLHHEKKTCYNERDGVYYAQFREVCEGNAYKTIVFPQNIEHLKICFCKYFGTFSNYSTGIVHKAITSLPRLKVLDAKHLCDPDIDQQLENINNLSNLHSVYLIRCKGLSVLGVETILKKCAILQKFNVSDVTFREQTYECLKECKYLGDIMFQNCILNPYKLVIAILAMKYLTNFYLYRCEQRNEDGQLNIITENVINNIIEECKFEKPYTKIYYS